MRLADAPQVKAIHVMCTINALCLSSLATFLHGMITVRQTAKTEISFTLNILRFPSFQSPLVLPMEKRMEHVDSLNKMLLATNGLISDMEHEHVVRLMQYLLTATAPHEGASPLLELEKDFKRFYTQYDQRRGKDLVKTFPELKDWYDDIRL
jgi:hypothetical protein